MCSAFCAVSSSTCGGEGKGRRNKARRAWVCSASNVSYIFVLQYIWRSCNLFTTSSFLGVVQIYGR